MKDPAKLIRKNPFILAPMDDVTDIAFRELCEENHASYSTTELTSIEALIRNKVNPSRYTKGNLKFNQVQLFGKDPEHFKMASDIVDNEADSIDINFGCPSATVTGNDSGAILLKDPKNVGKIISSLTNYSNKKISAKIRLGYKKTTYLEVAREIEDAGANLIAVHGRTAEQKYSGSANWDAIKEIHEKLKIPVIGNGDIKQEEDIDKYLNSHSSALMIGRAAIGNPLIFKKFKHYHKTGEKLNEEGVEIQKKLFINYLEKLSKHDYHKVEFKIQKQAMWFMKGISGAKELRKEITTLKNPEEIIEKIRNFNEKEN